MPPSLILWWKPWRQGDMRLFFMISTGRISTRCFRLAKSTKNADLPADHRPAQRRAGRGRRHYHHPSFLVGATSGNIERMARPGFPSGSGLPSARRSWHGNSRRITSGRSRLVFTTSNTPPLREIDLYGDPLKNIWENCVFRVCGVQKFFRKNFAVMASQYGETAAGTGLRK